MSERFDAIVIGRGPAGDVAIFRLAKQGLRVALCERELIGGECAYWVVHPIEDAAALHRGANRGPPRRCGAPPARIAV